MRPAEALPRIAAKLRFLIGVNQDMLGLASAHRHEECVQHEILSQRGLGGPADNAAGVEIHHDGQIEPAFPCAYVRNVGDPGGVRSWDGKTSLQRIGRRERGGVASDLPESSVAAQGFQVIGPHNPSDPMLATGLTRFAQIEKDPRGAVDPVTRRMRRADEAEQSLILHRVIREGSMQPGIEPAARHAEETAHHRRIKLLAMGFNEDVFQSDMLRSPSIPHWSSPCSHDYPKVSAKAWEVQVLLM